MKYLIGSDHGGYKLKEAIKQHFKKNNLKLVDVGPKNYDPEDDFNDYAKKLVKNLKKDKGILICGTGQGMTIQANRYKGVICSLSWNVNSAKHSKEHLNANVIALPSTLSKKKAIEIINTWKNSKFIQKQKYKRRLEKLDET